MLRSFETILSKIRDSRHFIKLSALTPARRANATWRSRAGGALTAPVRWTQQDDAAGNGSGRDRGAAQHGGRFPAGDIFFEKIGMLQPDELDREAFLDMPNHATRRLADGDEGANIG